MCVRVTIQHLHCRIARTIWKIPSFCRAIGTEAVRSRLPTNPHVVIVAFSIISALTSLLVFNFKIPPEQVRLPTYVDRTWYRLYQPDVTEDFPSIGNGDLKIPHIIHQTWSSTCVYKENIEYIRSFIDKNPDWTYYFWTDASARKLIEKEHPYLLNYWDNVRRGVQRGDILRYVVLYEFGGVYADTDVENLRPLDRVTHTYSCIFPTEPLEHNVLVYKSPYIINNGIMLCSPKHPFLRQLLDTLLDLTEELDVLTATGPLFVTSQFNRYNRISDDMFHGMSEEDKIKLTEHSIGTGTFNDKDERAVYIPNTHYFTDHIDIAGRGAVFSFQCKWFFLLSEFSKRACIELEHKGLYRNRKFTFTVHHWHHTWALDYTRLYGLSYYVKSCTEIMDIVPYARIYS